MYPSNAFNNSIKCLIENICIWYEKQTPGYDQKITQRLNIQFKVHIKLYLARHIVSEVVLEG